MIKQKGFNNISFLSRNTVMIIISDTNSQKIKRTISCNFSIYSSFVTAMLAVIERYYYTGSRGRNSRYQVIIPKSPEVP